MNKVLATFLASACLIPAVFASQTLMDQSFEQGFSPGLLDKDGKTPQGAYYIRANSGSAEIVNDGSLALKVSRKGPGQVIFALPRVIPAGKQVKLSMKVKLESGNSGVMFFGRGGRPGAAVLFAADKLTCAYTQSKQWKGCHGSGILPAGKWTELAVLIDPRDKSYTVQLTDENNKVSMSGSFPYLLAEVANEIRFLNSAPENSSYLVDDIKVEISDAPELIACEGESFEKLSPGNFPGRYQGVNGEWTYVAKPEESTVEAVSEASDGKMAVALVRNKDAGTFSFRPAGVIPSGYDSALSFKLKLAKNSPIVAYLSGDKGVLGGVLITAGGDIKGYNQSQQWTSSGVPMKVPVDEFVGIQIKFNAAKKSYSVIMTMPDGTVCEGLSDHPFLKDASFKEVRFIISHPVGSRAVLDEVKFDVTGKSVASGDSAGTGELFKLDMESFADGNMPLSGRVAGGKFSSVGEAGSYTVGADYALNGKKGLKVMRNGSGGYLGMKADRVIPDGHDYTWEFTAIHPEAESATILYYNADGGVIGGTWVLAGRAPCAYDENQQWIVDSTSPVMSREKYTLKVKFNVNEKCYEYFLTTADGKTTTGRKHPFLKPGPVAEIRIIPSLPQKSYVHFDDLTLFCEPGLSLMTRDVFAGSSQDAAFGAMLKGKNVYIPDGKTVDFEMERTGIGELLLLTPAEGKKLPATVGMRAYNASGHWIELGDALPVDPVSGQVKFNKTENLVKLELKFAPASDCAIAGAKVASNAGTPQLTLNKVFEENIQADYRLAVYDQMYAGCDKAELTILNTTSAPITVEVDLEERSNGSRPFGDKQLFTAKPGKNAIFYDLKNIPNGEYLTTIREITPSGKGGVMLRLLRHCTTPPLATKPRTEMSGQKMFFPDDFFLSEQRDVKFTTGQGNPILVHRGTNSDDEFIVYGDKIGLDEQGNLCVNFFTQNRQWKGNTRYYATASFDDLSKWTVSSGTAKLQNTPNALEEIPQESLKPDWSPKLDAEGKIAYRLYDPEKDDKVNLSQVRLIYIGHGDTGKAPGLLDYKWGVIDPMRTSVWAVWYRSPGEAIILSRPCSGFPTLGALELPDSGSDLEFGQWLEDDGKTLCYARGRHLMRYNPYAIKYDNIYDRNRVVGIWRTRDGVNWEQGYIGIPDHSKPESDQHYGGSTSRLPNAAGLRIATLFRYNAKMQQISWEIVYTWDGFRWVRFQNEPQFAENGPFGSWNHGGGYIMPTAIEHNGKMYQLMHWVQDFYHFEAEIAHYHSPTVSHMDAEYLRKRYEPRHLEEWPLFKKYFDNSYEKLSEHLRNSTCSTGVMEYRKDGFFYATAKDKEAFMVTTPVTANGKLTMNTVIRQGGFVEITLLDEAGKAIPGFERKFTGELDSVDLAVFDKLPSGKFKAAIKFLNADIYTLNF